MADYPLAQSPEDIPRLFVEAWQAKDADFLASLFREKAEFVNVVGIWWHTREQIRKAHAYGFETIFPNSELALGKLVRTSLTPTSAVVHARMRLKQQSSHPDAQQIQPRQTIMSLVVIKEQERWLCVSAHNTDIVPGAETNAIRADGSFTSLDYRDESE